jgi:hypothetical protein
VGKSISRFLSDLGLNRPVAADLFYAISIIPLPLPISLKCGLYTFCIHS